MHIFPSIDLYEGKAVRLYKGDYNKMTVYSDNPLEIAQDYENQGAEFIHLVDLEGAKNGNTPNIESVRKIVADTNLCAEIGGGIRDMDTIEKYLALGVGRVILGTVAAENPAFLEEAVSRYGDKIAVGVDIKDGMVAIHGWTVQSSHAGIDFCKKMQDIGVKTVICTDISRDGAMRGTNLALYESLAKKLDMDIIASGGVSSLEDIKALSKIGIYGAIVGKAYYEKAFTIQEAIEVAK